MLAHAGDLQDQNLSLKAMIAMATVYSLQLPQQDIAKSQALSEEALVLAQSLGDRSAEATINWNLMNTVAFSRGDPEQGLAYGEASLQIAREMNLKEQIAYTLNTMMLIYWNSNQLAKGQAILEEVRALWLELDNQPMLADSFSMAGFSYMMTGDYRTAVESYIELEHISKEINNTWNLNTSQLFLGLCYLETGEIGRGISYLEEAIKLAEQSNLGSNSVMATMMLALGYTVMGALDRANSLADEAFERRDEIFPLNLPLLLG
jgi:tetratricopeptide (TPR) repeat protein